MRTSVVDVGSTQPRAGLGEGLVPSLVAVLIGLLALYAPSYFDLANGIWKKDEQGHGPIIFMLTLWLLYRERQALMALQRQPSVAAGAIWLSWGLLTYVAGRSQNVYLLELGSQIPVLVGLALLLWGRRALPKIAFALFFLLFVIPLPSFVVSAVTAPLKTGVSIAAEWLLYSFGYPISRNGVLLMVGPYQLLVADACAGLSSMFTLEALGMLYLHITRPPLLAKRVTLAILIVPISFIANVTRVLLLILITYYFGDAAGQGFLHGFAGIVLFLVGLTIVLFVDGVVLERIWPTTGGADVR